MKKYTASFVSKTGMHFSHVIEATLIIEANYFALKHKQANNYEGKVKVYMIKGATKGKPRTFTNVISYKHKSNELLADPKLSVEFKEGIIAMLEYVLHGANAYNGFMFLNYNSENPPQIGTQEYVTRKYF